MLKAEGQPPSEWQIGEILLQFDKNFLTHFLS
jgi:hypothetical protein